MTPGNQPALSKSWAKSGSASRSALVKKREPGPTSRARPTVNVRLTRTSGIGPHRSRSSAVRFHE